MSDRRSRSEALAEVLRSELLQKEIHHLTWRRPSLVKGRHDMGWNCKDHALLVGGLALLKGLAVIAIQGRAAFICGGSDGHPPSGYVVDPHWWVSIEGIGDCDLSPRIDLVSGSMTWPWMGPTGLVGGTFLPAAAVHCSAAESDREFDQALGRVVNQVGGFHACYRPAHWEVFNEDTVTGALKWCDSPLSVNVLRPKIRRGDLHAKAILFLDDFISGKAASLTRLSQLQAWGDIARQPGNGRLILRERVSQSLLENG